MFNKCGQLLFLQPYVWVWHLPFWFLLEISLFHKYVSSSLPISKHLAQLSLSPRLSKILFLCDDTQDFFFFFPLILSGSVQL